MAGRTFQDRSDWWNSILSVPYPRIAVEDMDDPAGIGAFLGEMHGAMLRALACVGYVTGNETQRSGQQAPEKTGVRQ